MRRQLRIAARSLVPLIGCLVCLTQAPSVMLAAEPTNNIKGSGKMPTVHGLEPCCAITNIAGSLVTAKDNTTGKTFQFQATNQALAKSLRVGQTIYANFGTQQVSVDGATPCCGIVSGASATTGVPTIR